MRRPVAVAAGLCAATVVALAVVALAQRTALSFTLGVGPALPAATLQPRDEACQTPISVPPHAAFNRVVIKLGTFRQPGPQLAVEVRRLGTRQVLGEGTLAAGYADVTEQAVDVGEIAAGSQVAVCVLNRGERKVAVYGNYDPASRTSTALYNGKPAGTDMTMRFERAPRSMASLLGAMADRAALFKAAWVGGWTFWLLGALVLLAVPALLVRAVRSLE